jgi:hypothetical protein
MRTSRTSESEFVVCGLYMYMYMYMYMYIYVYIYLSKYLSIYLSIYLHTNITRGHYHVGARDGEGVRPEVDGLRRGERLHCRGLFGGVRVRGVFMSGRREFQKHV